jgi:chemotaxis protein MotB
VAEAGSNLPPIIVKKKKGGHHGSHSTAWKIALADFMTALFIIFLMLWLINQTTPEQRAGIADYFSPAAVSRNTSGSGGVFGGLIIASKGSLRTETAPLNPKKGGGPTTPQEGEGNTETPGYPGALDQPAGDKVAPGAKDTKGTQEAKGTVANRRNPDNQPPTQTPASQAAQQQAGFGAGQGAGQGGAGSAQAEQKSFEQIAQEIKQAIQANPDLSGLAQNVQVEVTPEGLRIQLIDNEKSEMFAKGSSAPMPRTKQLLQLVAGEIAKLPNKISVTGHTDSTQYASNATYTNWELSADRANATRRALATGGIPDSRISDVKGVADRDPLLPTDPGNARNRRISMVVLRENPPPGTAPSASAAPGTTAAADAGPTVGPAPDMRLINR